MTIKERTTIRIEKNNLKKLNEKIPNVNLSLLINNTLAYILEQNDEFLLDFTTKKP